VGVSLEATAPETQPSVVRKREQRTAPQQRKVAKAASAPVDPFDALFGTRKG
jgi:hypothetical protein